MYIIGNIVAKYEVLTLPEEIQPCLESTNLCFIFKKNSHVICFFLMNHYLVQISDAHNISRRCIIQ